MGSRARWVLSTSEDDVDWFLTLNKTHHEFSTISAKGGASAGRWVNPSFASSRERCLTSNYHTTGVYGITLRGEPLPPLYILSTASQKEDVGDNKKGPKPVAARPAAKIRFGVDVEAHAGPTKQDQRAPIKMVSRHAWSPGIYRALRLLGKSLDVAWERAFIHPLTLN